MPESFRTETDAYKAREEIRKNLHDDNSFFYKPWQFKDYEVCASTLKTTYEEINLWGREPAMIRPGWKTEQGRVYIPNLFAKVSGVHKGVGRYRKEMKLLTREPNTLLYKGFPMYPERKVSFFDRNYFSVLDRDGYLDKSRLLSSHFWKFRHLSAALQSTIADRIIDFCWLYRFKNYEAAYNGLKNTKLDGIVNFLKSFDININITGSFEDAARIRIFEVITNLEPPIIRQLELFDYPQAIPKIIVYNNGNMFSRICFDDAVRLMLLASLGMDVIIYNPAGYNDIEDFIDESYYDVHRLQQVAFNLPYNRWIFF